MTFETNNNEGTVLKMVGGYMIHVPRQKSERERMNSYENKGKKWWFVAKLLIFFLLVFIFGFGILWIFSV